VLLQDGTNAEYVGSDTCFRHTTSPDQQHVHQATITVDPLVLQVPPDPSLPHQIMMLQQQLLNSIALHTAAGGRVVMAPVQPAVPERGKQDTSSCLAGATSPIPKLGTAAPAAQGSRRQGAKPHCQVRG